jgi:hypothetical protein
VADDVGESNFGEVRFSHDDRLKQKKMRSPAIGQLWISGLWFVCEACVRKSGGEPPHSKVGRVLGRLNNGKIVARKRVRISG